MEGDDKYLISIYDIKRESLKEVFSSRVVSIFENYDKINYIINKKY